MDGFGRRREKKEKSRVSCIVLKDGPRDRANCLCVPEDGPKIRANFCVLLLNVINVGLEIEPFFVCSKKMGLKTEPIFCVLLLNEINGGPKNRTNFLCVILNEILKDGSTYRVPI